MGFEINQNIKALIDLLGLTPYEFSKRLGDKRPDSLYNVINNKVAVSPKMLEKVFKTFPEYKGFVLSGDGAPNSPTSPPTYQNEADPITDFNPKGARYDRKNGMSFQDLEDGKILMSVPLVGQYAEAGYLSGYNDPQYLDDLEKYSVIVDRHHRGVYRAFSVRGDSMDDGTNLAIMAGDIVLGRQVESVLWNSRFHLHDWEDFIIVHREGVIAKRILKHDVEKGTILLHSLNPDKGKYPDFEMPLEDVMEVYNIIEVTRKRRR